ncbi:MAG: formylglycine-generating enzyme family protein, partial [Cyanothece sp. SIO2G6]|nr:formylglycine-generating enzyme family protein [Cyanothece sp. SIO2G6]
MEQSLEQRQRSEIPMVMPDQTQKSAQVVWWYAGECHVYIQCNGQSWQGSGSDAWAALIDVRQYFEPDGYRLLCYGASLNGLVSGMSRDADMVRLHEWGEPPKRAKTKSIHDVFDTGPDVIPATYREQQVFKQQWHMGVKLDRKGIPYDVVEYPVVAVDRQGNLTRCSFEKNLVMTEAIADVPLEMVFIPNGTFLMGVKREERDQGGDRHYRDEPQHEVRIRNPCWLGRYPITKAQWRAVAALPQVQSELRLEPSQHRPHLDFDLDHHPISSITLHEAGEFCARLSAHTRHRYRLPTEAEWEYACKAGTTTPFSFGESFWLRRSQVSDEWQSLITSPSGGMEEIHLLNCDSMMKGTTPVGRYPPNPWGLYDMHGNVCVFGFIAIVPVPAISAPFTDI